jgi:hypothetical protein
LPDSEQGTGYAEHIKAELETELARRDSVNERSSKTLTSAGALVTLALAVFAVLIGKDFTLSGWAKGFVVAALVFLLLSAICSVIAGFPWTITRMKYGSLEAMLRKHWGDTEVTARGVTAYANLQVIKSLRPGTDKKFKFLLAAGILQIFAIAALVGATIFVASTQPKSSATNLPCVQTCPSNSTQSCPQACNSNPSQPPSPQMLAPRIDVSPSIAISPSIVVSVPLAGQPPDPRHKDK